MSDYGNLIQQSFGTRNPALPQTVGNIDEDPDKAARAMELAKVTGVPASAVYGDFDEFERTQKAQMASEIVRGNPHLSDFVQAHPLNSVIANDDYGNLDSVSQKTSMLDLPMKVLRAPEALGNILFPGDPLHRFKEGGPLGSWAMQDAEIAKNHPFAVAAAAGLGTPIELILRGLGGVQNTAADAAANLAGAVGQDALGRDLGAMVQSAGLTGRTGLIEHPVFKAADQYFGPRMYLENGREPLPTVLPEYDAFRSERNAKDVEALTDVVADAQTSTLRERNPDLFRDFIARHTDAEIGLSGDAVALLYGEKAPLPDDGLLGWVPNIGAQLDLARKSGDDISIPLADWVAKVDPEVMKALADDIRVRPGAITAREAQLATETAAEAGPTPPPLPEEVPTLRGASALEPLLSVGDRKIKLQRTPDESAKQTPEALAAANGEVLTEQNRRYYEGQAESIRQQNRFGVAQGFHDFELMDEKGNPVGYLNLSTQDGGKTLYVDMISGVNGLGPRDFGPALMRDLMKQLKAEFPEATKLTGHRVSGAREKAGTIMEDSASPEVKLDKLDSLDTDAFRRVLEGGQWETYSPAIQGYVVPDALRSPQTSAIAQAVREELDRIVPKKVAVETPESLKVTATVPGQRPGEPIRIGGVYIRYRDTYPIILAALDADNVMLTARHEAVHHLRQYGFFKPEEWATLEAEALAGNWFKKHNIDERYPNAKPDLKLEEAIAEEYPKWVERQEALRARADQIALPDSPLDAIFRRMKEFFDAIKERVSQILGKEATWEDVFKKVDTGEVGAREGTRPLDAMAFDERLSVEPPADPARVFERANALGMTIDQYKRYERLIAERHAEDVAATTKRIEAAQRKTQTAEWREQRKALRASVVDEINNRPDIAADNYFADGMLYGQKVESHEKLGTDFLTPEQRAALPRDYFNKAGAHPDDLAPLFGFPTGDSLVAHLSALSATRRSSGMRPIEFKRRMIDIETDRQMQLRYGVLEDNILDAVKEQVASETQLNLLAEETIYYGIKSGVDPAFDQATIKRTVADEFEQSSTTSVSSDRYLAAAGRAGRAVENALLKGDAAGAFQAKQRQYYATLLARNAVEFEAKVAKFEKLAARLSKREVKAVEPEYLDYIHGLLGEAGVPVKRSMDEIAQSKEHHGKGTLGDFVNSPENRGHDLDKAVSEALQQGPAKPLDQMTVAEANDFMDAVTALNHVGRDVRKIEIAGEKADFAEFREKVIDNLKQLPTLSRAQQTISLGKLKRIIDAPLTRMEELMKDADLRKELGPLHQAIIEPMMHAKAHEFDLMTDLSKHFRDVRGDFGKEWRRSLQDTIDQDIIMDPSTARDPADRAPYDMTRENLIQIMLNWGTRSNIGKYVQGAAMAKFGRRLSREEFPMFEAQIKALIDKHATAQDWQFVQAMWKPFKGWRPLMETVSRNTTGTTPKMIEPAMVDTPHGQFEGGYWPVNYDPLASDIGGIKEKKGVSDGGVFGNNYFRAATAKGYLKERTGYVDFVDISGSLEQAAGTMQQTIHDIAFRSALIQGTKIFGDKAIRAEFTRHLGKEYTEQLIPWLRGIAHQYTADEAALKWYNSALRRMRINLVGHALPLNLKVILSPDIGTFGTGAKVIGNTAMRFLQAPLPDEWASFRANREANMKLAMEKSDEIRHLVYNMDRDYRESLARITLDPTVGDLQRKAVEWGFKPIGKVSQEFRMSTFVDKYKDALSRGRTEQEAASIADSYVRERHGAASIVDLPAIMRGNETMKMLTMFYGYFNTMYNWQRQIPGNIRRREYGAAFENYLGSVVVGAAFGAVLFNQSKQDDSWFKHIAKALVLQPLSTVPFARDAASYFVEGYQPRTPLASLLGAAGSIITDAKKLAQGKKVEKPIQHTANIIGLSTGLPLAQAGRTGQFASDMMSGRQRVTPFARSPYKNITEWARGIITGEAKLKR